MPSGRPTWPKHRAAGGWPPKGRIVMTPKLPPDHGIYIYSLGRKKSSHLACGLLACLLAGAWWRLHRATSGKSPGEFRDQGTMLKTNSQKSHADSLLSDFFGPLMSRRFRRIPWEQQGKLIGFFHRMSPSNWSLLLFKQLAGHIANCAGGSGLELSLSLALLLFYIQLL
jgi:hypothetical protein